MALILQIESASKNCSIAVSKDGKSLACVEENSNQYVHSEKMHLFIEEAMRNADVKFKDLNAVAVGKGPGSYTGLRIGVSAAKGFCFALNIPLLAVDSLTVLAAPFFNQVEGKIIPMLDARRMEVYTSVFSQDGNLLNKIEAKILNENSFSQLLDEGPVSFLGDGSDKIKDLIKHRNAVFLDCPFPSAKNMSKICFDLFQEKGFEDLAYFEPFYLKDFVAGKPKKLL